MAGTAVISCRTARPSAMWILAATVILEAENNLGVVSIDIEDGYRDTETLRSIFTPETFVSIPITSLENVEELAAVSFVFSACIRIPIQLADGKAEVSRFT
jgi:hypothetical protein